MKRSSFRCHIMAGALIALTSVGVALSQDKQPAGTTPAAVDTAPKSELVQTTAVPEHSAGVDDILKMAHAKVSVEVVKTFVENSDVPYSLSASDIIALKEQGVSDDVVTVMVKRGAALRKQPGQTANTANTSQAVAHIRHVALDPESYEFFQYYYLYPRAVAAANQRLYSSYAGSWALSPYGGPYGSRYYGGPYGTFGAPMWMR